MPRIVNLHAKLTPLGGSFAFKIAPPVLLHLHAVDAWEKQTGDMHGNSFKSSSMG